jgi:hypothetical protein
MEYHKDLTITAGTYNVVVDNGTSGSPGVHITELGLFAAKGAGGAPPPHDYGSPWPGAYRGGNYFEDGVSLYEGGHNQYGGEAGSGAGSGGAGGGSVTGSTGGVGGPGTADGGTVRDRNNGNANTTLQITGGHYAGYSGGGGGTNNTGGSYSGDSYFGGGGQGGTYQQAPGQGIVILTYLSSTPGVTTFDTGQSGVSQADFSLTVSQALTDANIEGAGITISGTTDKKIEWLQANGGEFKLTGGDLSVDSEEGNGTQLKLGETQQFISVDDGGASGNLSSAVTVNFSQVDSGDEFDFGEF